MSFAGRVSSSLGSRTLRNRQWDADLTVVLGGQGPLVEALLTGRFLEVRPSAAIRPLVTVDERPATERSSVLRPGDARLVALRARQDEPRLAELLARSRRDTSRTEVLEAMDLFLKVATSKSMCIQFFVAFGSATCCKVQADTVPLNETYRPAMVPSTTNPTTQAA